MFKTHLSLRAIIFFQQNFKVTSHAKFHLKYSNSFKYINIILTARVSLPKSQNIKLTTVCDPTPKTLLQKLTGTFSTSKA